MIILHVAIPAPLQGSFDYLAPAHVDARQVRIGTRVRVPFGRRQVVGIVIGTATESRIERRRLKAAREVLDDLPVVPADLLAVTRWASDYYHHPLGEVLATALPVMLRNGRAAQSPPLQHWRLTEAGRALGLTTLKRAPRQAALWTLLHAHPAGLTAEALAAHHPRWRQTLGPLIEQEWVEMAELTLARASPRVAAREPTLQLNADQAEAVRTLTELPDQYQAHLLEGVTGSGKTEVYLRLIEQVVSRGRQALVLVPEIALTPQLVARFRARFDAPLAVLHSGLSDKERLQAWIMARDGTAPIVLGTRSAVFTPLKHPGAILIDEEHDGSFKQQDGFRYHARDVAVWRARHLHIPIVLGSATPSLESLHNVAQGRYRLLHLPERAGAAQAPTLRVLDVRKTPLTGNLSAPLLAAIGAHLHAGNQVLLFLNRRGFAPTLLCHDCGWVAKCRRCDAHLTYHHGSRRLRCHHCGAEAPLDTSCPACNGDDLRPLGHGTERVETLLQERFPDYPVARIDRDSTRRKGALESLFDSALRGEYRILLGTQMLAKGHHLPGVTLAAILDADQGLFGVDFRGPERMAQLITQVAGRAGRGDKPGEVIIQTHHPDHPLLHVLLTRGYREFAAAALAERHEAQFPPYAHLALLRAEATGRDEPGRFLSAAAQAAPAGASVELLGPVPAPMEKRAGRYRAQLLIQAASRAPLHRFLETWLPALAALPLARKVRWSIDVDPMEML